MDHESAINILTLQTGTYNFGMCDGVAYPFEICQFFI